ncbi:hypothetical protein [Actinomadura chokoriensis]|uniref:hypothetical protein n=1 Tax=Actinomadura chokoriensis TaxID=454156 RepID=UPI0035641D6A
MGLQRPVEPFHRPYAGPEPPSPARRPKRLLAVLVAVAAFAGAAVAVFLIVPGEDEAGTDRAAVTPRGSEPQTPSSVPSSEPAQQMVRALPSPCGTVSEGTVAKAIPKARKLESANSTLTTCTYTSTGSAFRWLRVETRLYTAANTATPVRDAESYYDAQWAQAHEAPLARTIALERQGGVGDEAYRWFKADEGQPTVVGQVTARVRNAVFTVSYSEQAPAKGEQAERERACLAKATAAAREVFTALNDF